MGEKVARDPDTTRIKKCDGGSSTGAEEVRIDRMTKGSAGPACNDSVDRLIGKRATFCAGPKAVMQSRAKERRACLAKISLEERRNPFRYLNFERPSGFCFGSIEDHPPFVADAAEVRASLDQRKTTPAHRPPGQYPDH